MELEKTLDNFIAHTGKSKVAVIIPLYGYWKDIQDNPLDLQTLQLSVDRIKSSIHNVYLFFVGEADRLPKNIQNFVIVQSKAGGNCVGIDMPKGSAYADYVRKGFEVSHETTDSAYFVVLNPWNIIQRTGIDTLIDRVNYGDEAKIVSGFNLRPEIEADKFDPLEFENLQFNIPVEKYKVDSNFMGITRQFMEMIPLDPNIKTAYFMEVDMFQNMHAKGFTAIASQRVPMFVFEVNIESLENPADLEADKNYFISKWGFNPVV